MLRKNKENDEGEEETNETQGRFIDQYDRKYF